MRLARFLYFAVIASLSLAPAAATGEFGPTTTLNGAALAANTPFAFHAVFDPANNVNPTPGAGYFRPTLFTIDIAGHGSFAGVPNVDLNVVVLDPTYHLGVYAAGLVTSAGTPFFLNTYATVAPPFQPESPTPTTFASFLQTLDSFAESPYVIPLTSGGTLAIHDFGPVSPTATLVAIPEPATLCIAALCGAALVARRGCHRRVPRACPCS
jgi:hypothetical protein